MAGNAALSAADVMVLQRLAGNAAVSDVLARNRREERQQPPDAGEHRPDRGERPAEPTGPKSGPSADEDGGPAKARPAGAPGARRLGPPTRPAPPQARRRPARPARPAMAPPGPGPAKRTGEAKAKATAALAKEEAASTRLQTALTDIDAAIEKVGELARPAESTDGGRQLVDALSQGEQQGRATLTAASRAGAAQIAAGATDQATKAKSAGTTARASVEAAVASTRARITDVTMGSREQVTSAVGSAKARIGSWQQQAQAQMGGAFDQGVTQINSATDQQASAVRAETATASQAVADRAANAAEQTDTPAGGGGEVGQARAKVAKKVGGDASATFRKEGQRSSGDLSRQGGEAAGELAHGGQDAAQALDAGRGEASTGIEATTSAAQQHTAQVGQEGVAALNRQAHQAHEQLGEVGAEASERLTAASAAHAARVQDTGARAARTLATKVTEVVTSAKQGIEQQAKKAALSKVGTNEAASGAGQLQSRLGGLYGQAGDAASQYSQQTLGHLAEAGVASTSALDQAAGTVSQHVGEGAGTHAASAAQLASTTASAADRAVEITTSSGAAAVERAATKVTGGATAAVESLNQAGTTATEHVAGKTEEATGKATQGTADAQSKVSEGQRRVDNAYGQRQDAQASVQTFVVQRGVWSWLKGQWSDFLNMITDPAFLIGLGVTLILLPFLGPGAVIVGGAVGGAVGGIEKNLHEGKPWYDWKNIVVGTLEGAVVGAVFAAASVALVYFGVGALAGALLMGTLSAGIGVLLNYIHGQPLDKGLLANFFLAALFHYLGEVIRGRAGPKAAVPERPGAGYAAIDPKAQPDGYTFKDTVNTKGVADVNIRTEVTTADGKTGYAERAYFRSGNRLVLIEVDLSKIPSGERWVKPAPDAKPVRLESYLTMRQMKLMEAELGQPELFVGPRTVQLRNVVNIDTVFQLARAVKTGASQVEALRTSRSVTYAERSITARGERITSVSESGGQSGKASQANNPAKMAEYGLGPEDPVRFGMTITIEVEPVPAPEPAAPSTKSGTPAVRDDHGDEDR